MGDSDEITTFGQFKRAILEKMKDVPIEPNIKECVHTLNKLSHIITTSSCEGHGDGSFYHHPSIWGVIEKCRLLPFLHLIERAEIHFAIYNIEFMQLIDGINPTSIQNGLFFKLRLPMDLTLDEARQRFDKLTELVKELV